MGPANEQQSIIVTLAAGTQGYIDPLYWMTHTLTKESDIYSLGVVLFEVLCGRLCCTYSNGRLQQNLVPTWTESYRQKKLNDIIFKSPAIQPMDQSTLEIFSDITYQCLKESREDRPRMAKVVTELKTALEHQELLESEEFSKWKEQLFYYEVIVKTAKPPLNYRSEVELMKLLYKGVLLNGGKTYFSLNKKGQHCEMISIAKCLGSDDVLTSRFSSEYNSRFAVGTYRYARHEILKTHVSTQFLSPGITYTVNLVFKFHFPMNRRRCKRISPRYRLQGERGISISYLAYEREDGWWMCELYQFTCDHRIVHFQIIFEGFHNGADLEVEGIEVQPLENVEHIDEKQPMSDSDTDANWEEKLPAVYQYILKRSDNSLHWTTKEEVYTIIRKGFLIKDDETKRDIWFSLDNNGKKCHMLSAKAATDIHGSFRKIMLLPESRFGEALQWNLNSNYIFLKTKVESQLLSCETTYACYLVYKLPEDQSRFQVPMVVEDQQCESGDKIWYIYLTSPQTPVIRPKDGQNTHNPLNRPKIKGLLQQRNDGWIEVQIWELGAATTINMELKLSVVDKRKTSGLIIEGIEFRPI